MAKKKTSDRTGLLSGPSRKQFDWQSPRTGEFVSQERRTVFPESAQVAPAGSTSLYVCPAGKRAKILSFTLDVGANSLATLTVQSDFLAYLLVPVGGIGHADQTFGYENGIDLSSGQSVVLTNDPGSTTSATGVIIVVEESAGGGYFTPS